MTPHEPVVPATPAAPAAPASPQLSERERIYAQHFNVPPPSPEPVVPAPAEIVPPADGIPPAPAEATPPALTTEQILQSLVQKIGDIEQKITKPAAPAAPVAPPAAPGEPKDWLTLLSEGKRTEAEAALADMIAQRNAGQLQNERQMTLAQVTAEREMNEFTAQQRAQNADIAEMEAYVAPRVQQRITAALQNGRIPVVNGMPSPADYVTVYKEAVADELKQARNFYLRVRGVGAAQAGARQAEVVATPALAPQAVAPSREPQAPATPEIETPQAYLARRQQRNAAFRGLAS